MKKLVLGILSLSATVNISAQKLTTTSAVIVFDATTSIDALPKAENKTVIGSFDKNTGDLAFEAAVNNFTFSNPMMQDHFNGANWMNSSIHPKFIFTGKVDKIKNVKFTKDGNYKVNVDGNLTVKGVSKPVTVPVIFVVTNGTVNASASFNIKLSDYGIAGQPIDQGKVAKEPKIVVNASF